jgi:hypothetical protein
VALVRTDVSEEPGASFIRVTKIGELGTTLAVTSNRRTLRRILRSVRRLLVAVKTSNIYTTYFFLMGHLQIYKLVVQSGSHKATVTATAVQQCLGSVLPVRSCVLVSMVRVLVLCSAPAPVMLLTVLLIELTSCSGCLALLDVCFCCAVCTLLLGRPACMLVVCVVTVELCW